MGQVICLLREGHDFHVISDDLLASVEELPTSFLSEALLSCQKIRQQITDMLELAAQAEGMINQIDNPHTRRRLHDKRKNTHLELTASLTRVSAAIHAFNITLSARLPAQSP